MRPVFFIILVLCIHVLTGCESKTFTPIPRHMETLISVNIKDGSLTFLDLKKEKVFTQWNLEQPVKGGVLFPDGNTLLLYGNELNVTYLYNLATGKIEKEWKTGEGIMNALVSNDLKHVFLTDQRQRAVRIFTINGKEIGKVGVGSQPLSLLQNRAGTMLYVVDFHDEKVDVVDVRKRKVVDTFQVPKTSIGGLLREHEHELWIGGHGSGSTVETNIRVYSLKTGKLVKVIAAPEMPVSFVETKQGIFALSHGSNTLRKWNEADQEVASLTVGANPFAMVGTNKQLYVASYDSDEIYMIDQRELKIVNKFKTGKGPFQLIIRGEDEIGKENRVNR